MAVDLNGNQIIIGYFRGTADFDPDPNNTFYLTSNGQDDIFIQKLDDSGNLLWAASMGDVSNDQGQSVTTDAAGNIYLTGFFFGTIDADPGNGYFELSQNRYTAFVLKIDPDGDLVWAKQMGTGNVGNAYGNTIALDNNQNVLTAGYFAGRVDFDPGAGIFNFSSSGSYDAFIQKLDNNGNFIWARQITGSYAEYISSITADASGNIYTSGSFYGAPDFNPDKKGKYIMTSTGESDIFFLKLNPEGNFVWAKQVGSASGDYGYKVYVDVSGFVYGTGQFYGTADFNPGSGTFSLTPNGICDLYSLKLDLNGDFVWAQHFGGASWTSGHAIKTDTDGNVYMTGYFYGTVDFNADPSANYFLTANGADDSFIYKSDPNGNFLWVDQIGGPGHDWGNDIVLDASGNIFITGAFNFTTDLNPSGNGEFALTNSGVQDIFLVKLNPSGGDDCPVPARLAANNITETSASLKWNAVTAATEYYVRYRILGTSDWTGVTEAVLGTDFSLSNLVAVTSYEFQIRTGCYSNYSYSGEFITLGGGGCIDNYEPNETMAAAASIPVNTDISALISTATDTDWFTFSSSGGGKNIKITLTNLPANYNVALYKSDGTLLGSSANAGTLDETIIYNTNKVATYYIKVYGAGVFNTNICYTLKVSLSSSSFKSAEAEIENNQKPESLTVCPNPSSSSFTVTLNNANDESVSIQLFDMSGRIVEEYKSLTPDRIITIGDQLDVGMYVAVITQGTYRQYIKLSKVR